MRCDAAAAGPEGPFVPYEFTIQRDPPLVLMRRTGPMDVQEWHATMLLLIADPDFSDGIPILFDARSGSEEPVRTQSRALATMWQQLVPHSRVAIVGPTAVFGIARQLELLTHEQVRAFTDTDEATTWLLQMSAPDSPG